MHASRVPGALALAAGLLIGCPRPTHAQIRASERATVSQTVDGTVITLEYSRPRARGRSDLFGEVVTWGEVWTPGANWATTLDLNKDIELEGHDVPMGTYSVWMVVNPDQWELVLDPRVKMFHTQHPEPTDDQIRFPVTPRKGDPVEVLTFSFPSYDTSGTTLELAWGTTTVPMKIEVQPSQRRMVTDEEAAPYVGHYELGPASLPDGVDAPPPAPMDIVHRDDGTLRATTMFPGETGEPEPTEIMLLPLAPGIFQPGLMEDGELVETMEGSTVEFAEDDDGVMTFLIRDELDNPMLSGRRTGGSPSP